MNWYQTDRPTKSILVQKLLAMGRGRDIMMAIKNEQRTGTGVGVFNGITVKRLDIITE